MRTLLALLPLVVLGCNAPMLESDDAPAEGLEEEALHRKDGTPLGPKPAGRATQLPIVLAHGFMGSSSNIWSFHGVAAALRADGHRVHEAEVPPFAPPEVRADELARHVDAALAEAGDPDDVDAPKQVNIIAHSMGGLDTRILAARPGYEDKIASILTVSTPHGGSLVADVALVALGGEGASGRVVSFVDSVANAAANAFFDLLGGEPSTLLDRTNLRATLAALSVSGSTEFNAAHPNRPGIYYQTWAGVSSVTGTRYATADAACAGAPLLMHPGTMDQMSPLLIASVPVVGYNGLHLLRPNDGVSTVQSARGVRGFECDDSADDDALGCFHFRGCFPADHLQQVGQIKKEGVDAATGFDHIRFYRNAAFALAAKGY